VRSSDPGHDAPAHDARADALIVERQIGREPRGQWTVSAVCAFGRPTVIAVGPVMADGTLFPTSFWLTCPWIVGAVSALESAGSCARWAARVATDPVLAAGLLAADARYRHERCVLGGGTDPCATVGIAGQADPLAVKCLHAHVAAHLAGVTDPLGAGALAELEESGIAAGCADDRCTRGSPAPDVASPG
jgi:hypothetical protein